MKCNGCGGKMVKVKYMNYEELTDFLSNDFEAKEINDYKEWLKTLKENDLVLTSFTRKSYGDTKLKYYLRVVEKKTKTGVKLKKLTKVFKFETGELVYKNKERPSDSTTYKIIPIDEKINQIVRKHCKNEEEFDIDKLNKLITFELKMVDNKK